MVLEHYIRPQHILTIPFLKTHNLRPFWPSPPRTLIRITSLSPVHYNLTLCVLSCSSTHLSSSRTHWSSVELCTAFKRSQVINIHTSHSFPCWTNLFFITFSICTLTFTWTLYNILSAWWSHPGLFGHVINLHTPQPFPSWTNLFLFIPYLTLKSTASQV